MKKNYLNKLLITCLTIPAFALSAYAGVDFQAGMNAYNKGNIEFAKMFFEKAIRVDEKDVNARYMYTQILIKEKKYAQAKKEYQKVIDINPSSKAAVLSRQGISKIEDYESKLSTEEAKKKETISVQNNTGTSAQVTATEYVKNAYRGGQKYLRDRGMTRIYIEPDETFKPLMQQAYSEWQEVLGSYVMFTYSGNKNDASDVVSFGKSGGGQGMQEGGYCQYNIDGNFIKGSTISINAYDSQGKPLPKEMVYHTMLHEIGHSIGIMGHSPYEGDIMNQGSKKFLAHLSERDKNTAQTIYKSYLKQPDLKSIQQAKANELQDIAKRIPNHPSGFIDMGDELMSQGQYKQALDCYKKAETLQPSVTVYFKEVQAYQKLNDKDNSANCYRKILDIDKSNKIALNNILAIYQEQFRYRDARTILDKFLTNNPNMAKDKQMIKLKQIFSDENIKTVESRQRFLQRN